MRRAVAAALVAGLAAATGLLLAAPAWATGSVLALSVAALRGRRAPLVAFAAMGVALNGLLLGFFDPGPSPWHGAGLSFGPAGALQGALAGVRLAAIVGVNLAVLSWWPPERLLEGLRLPPRPTAFVAAVLVAAHDLGRDYGRLVQAARLDGAWPRGPLARARAAAALLPAILVSAVRRAQVRRESLRLAGIGVGPRFVPLVAVTGLAVAGRLALLSVPNDPVTYAVVFLGGMAFGAATGALAGLLGMAVTNLFITGLAPAPFGNLPAMALVGALGGWFGDSGLLGTGRGRSKGARAWAALAGVVATFAFSLLSDLGEWVLTPELRRSGALAARLASGLAFNLLPALANAAVFASACLPVRRALQASGAAGPNGGRQG